MVNYRAVEVAGGQFSLTQRQLTDPGAGHVRLRVEACGVCHSDEMAVKGRRPDPSAPIVPGHEIVGVIDAVGPGVSAWQVGDRVGVGFLAGQCGECEYCRRGDFVNCQRQPLMGTSMDGGYAEYVVARASGLVRIPEGLSSIDAAPLLCAGLTTYVGVRSLDRVPGALVAVQGIGGLGHLAVQYANRFGYRVAAIARGTDKAEMAVSLGADHYIDSSAEDPGEALQRLGGAEGIIATASSGASMSPLIAGLKPRGEMVVVGVADDSIAVQTLDLISGSRRLRGSLTGTSIENEDNLQFSLDRNIRPLTEVMPLSEAPKAYEYMMSGRPRFRVVLDMTA
ncbi:MULTISPECIES: alcohol dehydrogenase [Streptomyces]|uniref:alcohol dehydrogenase n=1 Tax=Streptomyces dengpaensis TaxID=2049881 RepID=A0ABM6SJK3_9ACTN|nr:MULTISPECIES: alcohol dehydrogenase [Streptomyces]AVH54756.1 alcohol dehydrogenase [Streptomyces dengpaensis]PIB03834.1 alcohol dehydrogenase [Streptomyces sp. HG99]